MLVIKYVLRNEEINKFKIQKKFLGFLNFNKNKNGESIINKIYMPQNNDSK